MNSQQPATSRPDAKEIKEAALVNCTSLINIVQDINNKLYHQLMGNCDVLETIRVKGMNGGKISTVVKDGKDEPISPIDIEVFQKAQVNVLIRSPIRMNLARLNGIVKVLHNIRNQISEIPDMPVSTGNCGPNGEVVGDVVDQNQRG